MYMISLVWRGETKLCEHFVRNDPMLTPTRAIRSKHPQLIRSNPGLKRHTRRTYLQQKSVLQMQRVSCLSHGYRPLCRSCKISINSRAGKRTDHFAAGSQFGDRVAGSAECDASGGVQNRTHVMGWAYSTYLVRRIRKGMWYLGGRGFGNRGFGCTGWRRWDGRTGLWK